jgi:hypothetical protein
VSSVKAAIAARPVSSVATGDRPGDRPRHVVADGAAAQRGVLAGHDDRGDADGERRAVSERQIGRGDGVAPVAQQEAGFAKGNGPALTGRQHETFGRRELGVV